MSVVRLVRLSCLGVLVAVALVGFAGASSAGAVKPWWQLDSSARPTDLHAGGATDEVQTLTVSATGGEFVLERVGGREEINVAIVKFDEATHEAPSSALVQTALEEGEGEYDEGRVLVFGKMYGKGNVHVSGGPADEQGSKPYEIAFVGELVDAPVSSLEVYGDFLGEFKLSGGRREAALAEKAHGKADGQIVVTAANLGDAEVNGARAPVVIADKLPKGLQAVAIKGKAGDGLGTEEFAPVVCSLGSLSCTFEGELPPYDELEVVISVTVAESAAGGVNEASVSGGLAPAASVSRPVDVGAQSHFGVENYSLTLEEEGGASDTQAGSHPFQVTGSFTLNQKLQQVPGLGELPVATALPKGIFTKLPPGLIGNPTPLPQCALGQFLTDEEQAGGLGGENACPAQTAVGVAMVTIGEPALDAVVTIASPIFNLEPAVGEPARFGFTVPGTPVLLDTSLRTGGDYGVTLGSSNISQTVSLLSFRLTFWGAPADARHNSTRGWGCLQVAHKVQVEGVCNPLEEGTPPPFLSLPTSCPRDPATGRPVPLSSSLEGDSWQEPGVQGFSVAAEPMPALDGCNKLPFGASISVVPDGQEGSTPTGLSVGIHIPQDATLAPEGLAESAVKDTTVALPEGVQISPAAADGLLACSIGEVGFTGVEAGTNLFTPGPAGCPDASKVGTVRIKTPLLSEPLEGGVYLAAQDQNPFGSLIALYLDAENSKEGVVVKLAGEVKLDERTGQLVATFPNNPEVSFEEARLHFFGGDRAPLSTPPLCGSYTSTARLTPWSANPPAIAGSTFQITSGPNGSPCASPRPFHPGFQAGTTSVQAGGYSPLTMTMTRPDADQQLGKLSVVFPPGISAGLQNVKLCEEPQAATGACPAESQIGQVIASAGLGGDPYSVETGKAYITGPYEGAPFGVDVVVPAVAGPFNLGTEVVRSKVEVDPTDAHLTVVSDKFPTMLDGIPLQLQHINVTVNRPGFVFNPTSCEPMQLTGELESSEGAKAAVSTPFQVTNCAALSFKPEFKVSTEANTSRTEGATLHVKLTIPAGAEGTKANVHEVKVSLPKQLPSPLKTLQKACTEKVFAENPSNCPVASRVGEAHVTTPVLEGGLKGPAYFVSHGGAKYPELIMVLVGEDGVTVQVHGETFISKQGITTATFSAVPDVPFSTFELELPKRESPALSANGNLCQAQAEGKLLMPTEMLGQNGDKIAQSTKITVTGCGKVSKPTHKKKHSKHHKKHAKGANKKR